MKPTLSPYSVLQKTWRSIQFNCPRTSFDVQLANLPQWISNNHGRSQLIIICIIFILVTNFHFPQADGDVKTRLIFSFHILGPVPITDIQLQLRLHHTLAITIDDLKRKDDTKRFNPDHHEIQCTLLPNWKRILHRVPRNVYQCKWIIIFWSPVI